MRATRIVFCALLALDAACLSPAASSAQNAFTLSSAAFANGGLMPKVHECTSGGGNDPAKKNESPPLAWSGLPPGRRATRSSCATSTTPTSSTGSSTTSRRPRPRSPRTSSTSTGHRCPCGSRQVYYRGSASLYGYQGPCSPSTVNTYEFVVHALDRTSLTGLNSGSSTRTAVSAITAASIGSARITGES